MCPPAVSASPQRTWTSYKYLDVFTFIPEKVENVLKLFTDSLNFVMVLFCKRKARRRDREPNAPGAADGEQKLYLQEPLLRRLPEVDLNHLTTLPSGLDYNEWLASHTIAFFEHVNLIYGTISEFCTTSGCPDMSGPGLRQYLWFDEKGKKTKVAAPQYIDYVMTFTQKTLNDESIFPTKYANEFPSSFLSIVKKIQRLLFYVISHLYHAHFRELVLLNLHAHLNCVFAHFCAFNQHFQLVDAGETDVLLDLAVALKVVSEAGGTEGSSTTTTTTTTTSSSTTTTTTTEETPSQQQPPPNPSPSDVQHL